MRRYIALLRGINISGKNKVPMAELKKCFEALGFPEVKTWLNSGNVIFSSADGTVTALTDRVGRMIQREFGLDIPVFIIPQEELADILRPAPEWWGTEIRGSTMTSFSFCRLRPFRKYITRSARRKRAWSKYRNMDRLCSGHSAERTIRKPTGGQRRPARLSARN